MLHAPLLRLGCSITEIQIFYEYMLLLIYMAKFYHNHHIGM